jgi:hypothetical protein
MPSEIVQLLKTAEHYLDKARVESDSNQRAKYFQMAEHYCELAEGYSALGVSKDRQVSKRRGTRLRARRR